MLPVSTPIQEGVDIRGVSLEVTPQLVTDLLFGLVGSSIATDDDMIREETMAMEVEQGGIGLEERRTTPTKRKARENRQGKGRFPSYSYLAYTP